MEVHVLVLLLVPLGSLELLLAAKTGSKKKYWSPLNVMDRRFVSYLPDYFLNGLPSSKVFRWALLTDGYMKQIKHI